MHINELYRSVTNRIIEELERGAAPWLKPWKTGRSGCSLMPRNAATNRPYRGINIPILWDAADRRGFPSHAWMTLRQANEKGGRVRRRERGTTVVLLKRLDPKDEDGEPGEKATGKSRAMLRTYTVFNVAQIDGIDEELSALPTPEPLPEPLPERLRSAQAFVSATGADIRYGFDGAWYAPGLDFIAMPAVEAFNNPENVLGIEGDLRHAGYIDHWIALLREDTRAIFTAAVKASQAADFLRSLQPTGQ